VLSIIGIRIVTMLGDRLGSGAVVGARPTPAPVFVATPVPPPTQAPPKPTIAPKPAAPTPVPAAATAPPQPSPTMPPAPTATAPPPATATPAPKPTTPPPPAGLKTVPAVVLRSEADATKAIRDAGLTVKVDERRGQNMADGQVLAQNPPAGNQVLEGSTVTIIVAREGGGNPKPAPKPGLVLVPNVEGMDEKDARKMLEDAGFRVEVRQESSRERKGEVINQNPEAGNSVRPNVPVRITIGT
jgi:hypothetical protein